MTTTTTEPLSVLVVDDDGALLRTLSDILRLHGYAPESAETGAEGLAMARTMTPALAIVDLRLPDMGGIDLIARLREISETTEVVIVTGNASLESAVAALRENSIDYLVKPVQVPELLHAASVATERWQRRRAERALRKSEAALRQAQRLEAVGRLAGGVAHDFNNMLTAITGYSEMVLAALPAGDAMRADMDEILKAAHRAATLTRQLLAFSRQQVLQPRHVNLNDIVIETQKMLRRLIGADIEFLTSLDPDLAWTMADPGQLEQVIVNLCVNARDAMPGGGTLSIDTANAEMDSIDTVEHSMAQGSYVMLAVTDTGTGMDADTKARAFEPFFTTKSPDKGTGLGLATVYGIVKQSGGEIWLYSEPGHGTTVKVFLPRALHPVAAVVKQPRAPLARGHETVLLAEDEDTVRKLAHRILERAGYTVLVAKDGTEALSISETHAGTIHLLISDMVMPQLNGRQLADQLQETRPEMRVLFLSGYTDHAATRRGLLNPGEQFLQKPFATDSLTRKVRDTLDDPTETR